MLNKHDRSSLKRNVTFNSPKEKESIKYEKKNSGKKLKKESIKLKESKKDMYKEKLK